MFLPPLRFLPPLGILAAALVSLALAANHSAWWLIAAVPLTALFALGVFGFFQTRHPPDTPPPTVRVGGGQCSQPYEMALLNVSAVSFGSLSSRAIEALNLGAARGGFAHDTGEGGISRYHLNGGDLIWEIGSAYFGCRTGRVRGPAGDGCRGSSRSGSASPPPAGARAYTGTRRARAAAACAP